MQIDADLDKLQKIIGIIEKDTHQCEDVIKGIEEIQNDLKNGDKEIECDIVKIKREGLDPI